MTCADLIAQYEASLLPVPSGGDATIGSFSLTQHWPNGAVGHGSGWLHYIGTPIASYPKVTVFIGQAHMSYAPNGNPIVISVAGQAPGFEAGVGIAYAGATIPIGTDLTNLDCNTMGATLVLVGTESPHKQQLPPNPTFPEYDLLSLGTFELANLGWVKSLGSALAGVGA
jgi:hypothetical protein